MKLYYVPKTRSNRPRWLLEEMGVPYELVRLDPKAGDNHRPEYLALNPTGHVPTLVDGEVTLYESAAILMYLADKFPEKRMAPPVGSKERGLYYQWTFFGMATLEPSIATYVAHTRSLPEDKRSASEADGAKTRFLQEAAALDKALSSRQFLLGDQLTAADVLMGSVCAWANGNKLLEELPGLATYAKTLLARPAAQKARGD